ncbi:hypothetical protein SAMN03159453_05181 [Pseudomonas sp. NFIX28]|nr:hypothetical protein SAMN03159453_05181 [Pseudomonas sp. NFIX28]
MSSFVVVMRRVSDGVHIRCCGNGGLGFCPYGGGGVHIRYCGHGCWRFRPYGDSLFSNAKKVSKNACPSIRCLARARHALTPALLRGPAATGHPWPGAASAASLPRYPLRNACVRPLGKGRVDQRQDQKPSALYAPCVAAAAGCDRLRSRRKIIHLDPPDTPRRPAWRALRARSQPAAAATGVAVLVPGTFLHNACVWPQGKGWTDQKPSAVYAPLVAAAAGCDRLRSRRKTIHLDPPDTPRRPAWRALRARSQPAAAATGDTVESRPTGRSPRVVFDFLAPSGGLRAFGYFGLAGTPGFKVTRHKGETLGGHDRSTGSVHSQPPELLP